MNKNKINNLEEQVKNCPIDEKLIETIGDKAHKLETDAFAQVDFNNLTNPGDLSKRLESFTNILTLTAALALYCLENELDIEYYMTAQAYLHECFTEEQAN